MKDAEDDGRVHKLDTTPPPEGEDDAYNAPTKVGDVSHEAWAAMITQAQADLSQPPPSSVSKQVPPSSQSSKRPSAVPDSKVPADGASGMPRLYEDEADDAATLLHPNARSARLGQPIDSSPPNVASTAPPPASRPLTPPPSSAPLASAPSANATGPFAPPPSSGSGPSSVPRPSPRSSGPAPAPVSAPPSSGGAAAPVIASPMMPSGTMPPPPLPVMSTAVEGSSAAKQMSIPPSLALLNPVPNPASFAPAPPRKDYLLLVIGVAATLGFLTLAVGILLAMGRL